MGPAGLTRPVSAANGPNQDGVGVWKVGEVVFSAGQLLLPENGCAPQKTVPKRRNGLLPNVKHFLLTSPEGCVIGVLPGRGIRQLQRQVQGPHRSLVRRFTALPATPRTPPS